jgi:hypothetical protein
MKDKYLVKIDKNTRCSLKRDPIVSEWSWEVQEEGWTSSGSCTLMLADEAGRRCPAVVMT